jgi:hypothetical protein
MGSQQPLNDISLKLRPASDLMVSFREGSAYIGKFMNPSITVPFNSLNLCSTRSTCPQLAQPGLNPGSIRAQPVLNPCSTLAQPLLNPCSTHSTHRLKTAATAFTATLLNRQVLFGPSIHVPFYRCSTTRPQLTEADVLNSTTRVSFHSPISRKATCNGLVDSCPAVQPVHARLI